MINLSGNIHDAVTGETLPGASVYVSDGNGNITTEARGTVADAGGNFTLQAGLDELLTVSFVGYKKQTFHPQVFNNIALQSSDNMIGTVEIVADKIKKFNYAYLAIPLALLLLLIAAGSSKQK